MRMLPALTVPPALYHRTRLPRLVRAGVSLAFRPEAVRALVRRIYGLVVILGKPRSRGSVRLASARPGDFPRIDPAAVQWGIVFIRTGTRQARFGEIEMPDDVDDLMHHRALLHRLLES